MEGWFFALGRYQGHKNFYPVQLTEYDIANGMQDQPTFAWCIPHTLRERNSIVKKIKSKYWQRTHKYGISIPKYVKEALNTDKDNGNNLWNYGIK